MKKIQTDQNILKSFHKFVRPEDEAIDPNMRSDKDYGNMIARKYYDKLFKEYAIIDLSSYQTGQIGMRWRTEQEVLDGRGESTCGNKRCKSDLNLCTWEVNFKYKEEGQIKQTLVKVKCCGPCSEQLNFKKQHKQVEDKIYTEEDIKRMLKKLEAKKAKIKQEDN